MFVSISTSYFLFHIFDCNNRLDFFNIEYTASDYNSLLFEDYGASETYIRTVAQKRLAFHHTHRHCPWRTSDSMVRHIHYFSNISAQQLHHYFKVFSNLRTQFPRIWPSMDLGPLSSRKMALGWYISDSLLFRLPSISGHPDFKSRRFIHGVSQR